MNHLFSAERAVLLSQHLMLTVQARKRLNAPVPRLVTQTSQLGLGCSALEFCRSTKRTTAKNLSLFFLFLPLQEAEAPRSVLEEIGLT